MSNFYIDMQKFSWTKANCFIANGRYTPQKNGKYKEYLLYVINSRFMLESPSKQESVNMLIKYAKKNYKFDSVDIHKKDHCIWLIFTNLTA